MLLVCSVPKTITAVGVEAQDGSLRFGTAGHYVIPSANVKRTFAVSGDGRRLLLFVRPDSATEVPPLSAVVNWTGLLPRP